MKTRDGYYRYPTIYKETVVFVSEDDLWRVSLDNLRAERITATKGAVSHPRISPDGQWIAFTATEEGHAEVYCMPLEGGEPKRLTFLGATSKVVGWTREGEIIFASNGKSPIPRMFFLYKIPKEGGSPERLPYGVAHSISFAPKKGVVLGRNTAEPAYWKRYRGGTVGVLWVDPEEKGNFKKLLDWNSNLTSPLWVGERISFISDHENIGALYSVLPDGSDLKRHSRPKPYYVRNAATDGEKIVYHAGGDLFLYDPREDREEKLSIRFRSFSPQRSRKFVPAEKYLETASLHPKGHSLTLTSRGKLFAMANWEGGVLQLGEKHGVRYRLPCFIDERRIAVVSDKGGEERVEIHDTELEEPVLTLPFSLGRPLSLKASPDGKWLALTNHRLELLLIHLETKELIQVDRSPYHRLAGLAWSPDSQWIAYSIATTQKTYSIKLYSLRDRHSFLVTPPRFRDLLPSFDPSGKYLYFLSYREFNPVYDSHYFDLNFPKGNRPYVIVLSQDTPSPFEALPRPLEEEDSKDSSSPPSCEIDLLGIEKRILPLPVPEGKYLQVEGALGKILFSHLPVEGALEKSWLSEDKGKARLEYYDLKEQKIHLVADEVSEFTVGRDGKTLLYRSGSMLRVIPIAPCKEREQEKTPGRHTGWIDLSRIRVEVDPPSEWRQMYREIWRLQRDQFWSEDMCGIDWEKVYNRYLPLLDRIGSRGEFSDLIWEMQGELGCSHAYELGGDYRTPPSYHQGFLGADYAYSEEHKGYEITHILKGDIWEEKSSSPLLRPGKGVEVGDVILAIDGQKVSRHLPPEELLVHKREKEVSLLIWSKKEKKRKKISVKTLPSEFPARYREWVEKNRAFVLEKSEGQVGYLHIPDMGPRGYAEFHRYYRVEIERPALIVDVRYNGGGHVSQLILEKLMRRPIGYDIPRWGVPEPYPSDAPAGPVVAITNEFAGSDGDLFSHCFKLLQIGILIGKRTWGGVIGIWPRHRLVDGSITTQPEFFFWIEDVGFGLENYGTDPDIEVEITPKDWQEGRDPQLERAVEEALEALKRQKVKLPDFGPKPVLHVPDGKE